MGSSLAFVQDCSFMPVASERYHAVGNDGMWGTARYHCTREISSHQGLADEGAHVFESVTWGKFIETVRRCRVFRCGSVQRSNWSDRGNTDRGLGMFGFRHHGKGKPGNLFNIEQSAYPIVQVSPIPEARRLSLRCEAPPMMNLFRNCVVLPGCN